MTTPDLNYITHMDPSKPEPITGQRIHICGADYLVGKKVGTKQWEIAKELPKP